MLSKNVLKKWFFRFECPNTDFFSSEKPPIFPKAGQPVFISLKGWQELFLIQTAVATQVFKSNYDIFKTLPYISRVPANNSAICLPVFSVTPEILTPCPWSKPLLWLFKLASCFSHSLSVCHAADKLSFWFRVIFLESIIGLDSQDIELDFSACSDIFFLVLVTVRPRVVMFLLHL